MAKNMNRKGRRDTPPFIMLRLDIYDHPAWKALSSKAVLIWLEIRKRYNGRNNGEISLSVREAAIVAHCSKDTALKALNQLQTHGFIKMNNKGHFQNRHATTWTLTCEKLNDLPPTSDWRSWQPPKL